MSENKSKVKNAIFGDSFHGETWYRCPHCNGAVEYYSFKPTKEKGIYECPHCGEKVRFS